MEKDLAGIKENTKKGHDFAARVFVIKKTGATPYLIEQLTMYFLATIKLDKILQVLIQKNQ